MNKVLRGALTFTIISMTSILMTSCEQQKSQTNEPVAANPSDAPTDRQTSGTESRVVPAENQPRRTPTQANRQATQIAKSRSQTANTETPSELGYEVLSDLGTIKVEEGMPSPKIGDRIYTLSTLPKGECGEFWVKDRDGSVAKIAVCTGEHEGGH